MHDIDYNTPQHPFSVILAPKLILTSIPCLADRLRPLPIWRELQSLEWAAASLEERPPLRTSGRCYAMDALGMGRSLRVDMKLRPGTTPAMSAKERYEYLN